MQRKLLSSIALALVIGTGSALAQDPATPGHDPYRPAAGDDDRGFDFGWIGLLGLAGLLGLKRAHANEPMPARAPATR